MRLAHAAVGVKKTLCEQLCACTLPASTSVSPSATRTIRPGVIREQVFEAAEPLAQEDIQPTAKLVRDPTGRSFSTITPHLAAWKGERGGGGAANIPDMPESERGER
jgi:hypothetical protein